MQQASTQIAARTAEIIDTMRELERQGFEVTYLDVQPDGRVKFTYTWGTGKDIWQDYTLRGGGNEQHQTLFCYAGAQYVQVEGAVPEGRDNPDGLPVLRSLEQFDLYPANQYVTTKGKLDGAIGAITEAVGMMSMNSDGAMMAPRKTA